MQDMEPYNILDIRSRADFRSWLGENHGTEKECWIAVKRGRTPVAGVLWYLDAVEEALCFGWIDSTVKNVGGVALQRFGPRAKSSRWTELNKERCRRLDKLGLMTDAGRAACPDLYEEFVVMEDIVEAFKCRPGAWEKFNSFPGLYRRVRLDNIQRNRSCREIYTARLEKLISASERGEMIGDWHDNGRLLDY